MTSSENHKDKYRRINREIDETAEFVEDFDEQLRREDAQWGPIEETIEREIAKATASHLGVDFRAVTDKGFDEEGVVVRTVAHFERLLAWYEESKKLWRNGYIDDNLQQQIAEQFMPEVMGKWRLNLMQDTATPDEVLSLQERMESVCEDASFVRRHIGDKTGLRSVLQPNT